MIFLVDDNDELRIALVEYIATLGFEIQSFPSAEYVLAALDTQCFDVQMLITDVELPGMGGRALVEQFWRFWPGVPVIIISGYLSKASSWIASSSAIDFFHKPIQLKAFGARIIDMLGVSQASHKPTLSG